MPDANSIPIIHQTSPQVSVCCGRTCTWFGSEDLLELLEALQSAGIPLEVTQSKCTKQCSQGPVIVWKDRQIVQCSPAILAGLIIENA
jgi:NADH:ubiquinone oxidoreductase subunit E